jgi:hypothetical protein
MITHNGHYNHLKVWNMTNKTQRKPWHGDTVETVQAASRRPLSRPLAHRTPNLTQGGHRRRPMSRLASSAMEITDAHVGLTPLPKKPHATCRPSAGAPPKLPFHELELTGFTTGRPWDTTRTMEHIEGTLMKEHHLHKQ